MPKIAKLERCTYPAGTNANSFKCYGPVATKDTEFENARMADMGCFSQDGKDSNKFYHVAMVTEKNNWYVFTQFGRQGVGIPQYQFTPCSSESEAKKLFIAQCKEKNTNRGEWQKVGGIELFRPKVGKDGKTKDLYVVRSLASRTTGLPDAQNIAAETTVAATVKKSTTSKSRCDAETAKLLRDLKGGTVTYARSTIQGGNIPGQSALDQGRTILTNALKRVAKVGNRIEDQIEDTDLKSMSYALYSLIPKIKPLHCSESEWILSENNIGVWGQDIDAWESALKSGDVTDVDDPLSDMPLEMEWIDPKSDHGKYVIGWWTRATRNRHANVGNLEFHGLWKVKRQGELEALRESQETILKEMPKSFERPLHQEKDRYDLTAAEQKLYWDSNTALTFHGTRSINASGILREGFRFPKELVNVTINYAALGGGNYQADDYKKSCGYCSHKRAYWNSGGINDGMVKNRRSFMFACDTIIGNPHTAPEVYGYTQPPKGCHSVFGKGGHTKTDEKRWHTPHLENNEWVVYSKGRVAIRYLAEIDW